MHVFFSHVEYEDGLFILVVESRTAWYKNLQVEVEKFLKSQAPPAHFISHPAFLNPRLRMLQSIKAWCIWTSQNHIWKSKVMEVVLSRFYWQNGTTIKLL
jgi:hypothetical protein